MNKDISKKLNNQACNKRNFKLRRMQQFQRYNLFSQTLDTVPLKNALERSKRGKSGLINLIAAILHFKRNGKRCYAGEEWLAKKLDLHPNHVSRLVNQAMSLGVIFAKQRYYGGTHEYHLNPAMNVPAVQHALSSYFTFLKVLALNMLLSIPYVEGSVPRLIHVNGTDVNLIEKCYILNIRGSKRSDYRGVPEMGAERVDLSVTGDLQRSGLVYGSSTGVLTRGVDQIARTDMSSTIQNTMARLASQSGNTSTNERNFVSQDPAAPANMHRSFVTTTVKHRQASQGESMSIEASAPERPTFDKYPHRPSVEAYEGLRMTPFGMMKLSIIPQGIADSIYNDIIINNKKMPSYDVFMNECLHRCQEMHINMKPLWSQFFKACEQRGIDHKKTATVKQYTAPPTVHSVRQNVLSEEDFWVCERAKYTNRIKWRALGAFIKNPYEDYMATLESYQYPDLYAMYKEVQVNGMQNPELLPLYHQELCKVFNIPLEDN